MTTLDIRQKISTRIKEMPDSEGLLLRVLVYVNELANNPFLKQFDLLYKLQDNWDGYGAPKISNTAIDNCMTIVNKLKVSDNVEILPTEIGGVQILYKPNTSERLSCNIGDKELSYYVKKDNTKTFFSPFLECNEQNFNEIANKILLWSPQATTTQK